MAKKKLVTRDILDAREKQLKELGVFIDQNEYAPLVVDGEYQEAWDYLDFCEDHKNC